jgi:hypothetical protein
VRVTAHGAYTLRLRDLRGNLVAQVGGQGPGEQILPLKGISTPFAILEAQGLQIRFRRLIDLPAR